MTCKLNNKELFKNGFCINNFIILSVFLYINACYGSPKLSAGYQLVETLQSDQWSLNQFVAIQAVIG